MYFFSPLQKQVERTALRSLNILFDFGSFGKYKLVKAAKDALDSFSVINRGTFGFTVEHVLYYLSSLFKNPTADCLVYASFWYFFLLVTVFMRSFYFEYVCVITTQVLCARSQDLAMSVSVRRVHVVLSTAGFKGGEKPCQKTRETAALQNGIQKTSRT